MNTNLDKSSKPQETQFSNELYRSHFSFEREAIFQDVWRLICCYLFHKCSVYHSLIVHTFIQTVIRQCFQVELKQFEDDIFAPLFLEEENLSEGDPDSDQNEQTEDDQDSGSSGYESAEEEDDQEDDQDSVGELTEDYDQQTEDKSVKCQTENSDEEFNCFGNEKEDHYSEHVSELACDKNSDKKERKTPDYIQTLLSANKEQICCDTVLLNFAYSEYLQLEDYTDKGLDDLEDVYVELKSLKKPTDVITTAKLLNSLSRTENVYDGELARRTLYCSTSFFTFLRLFEAVFTRLLIFKGMDREVEADEYMTRKTNLEEHGRFTGVDFSRGRYDCMLRLFNSQFAGELEEDDFEQIALYISARRVRYAFSIELLVGALIEQIIDFVYDPKSLDLVHLFHSSLDLTIDQEKYEQLADGILGPTERFFKVDFLNESRKMDIELLRPDNKLFLERNLIGKAIIPGDTTVSNRLRNDVTEDKVVDCKNTEDVCIRVREEESSTPTMKRSSSFQDSDSVVKRLKIGN